MRRPRRRVLDDGPCLVDGVGEVLVGVVDHGDSVLELPNLYSHYGSRVIVLDTVLQSWSQRVEVWGESGMKRSVWSVQRHGLRRGVSVANFLEDLSRMVGDYDRLSSSTSTGRGQRTVSQQLHRERILDVADVAALPKGRAVVPAPEPARRSSAPSRGWSARTARPSRRRSRRTTRRPSAPCAKHTTRWRPSRPPHRPRRHRERLGRGRVRADDRGQSRRRRRRAGLRRPGDRRATRGRRGAGHADAGRRMAAHARATAQLDDARDTLADARAPCMSPRPRSPTTETTRRRRGSNVSRRLRTSKARRVLAWRTAARSAPGSASSRQRHTFAASSSTPASGVARRPPADCAASSSAASTTATVSVVTTGLAMPSSDSKYRVPGVVGADCPRGGGQPGAHELLRAELGPGVGGDPGRDLRRVPACGPCIGRLSTFD